MCRVVLHTMSHVSILCENANLVAQNVPNPNLDVVATISALQDIKDSSTISADRQVIEGAVENYRSNPLLSMIGSNIHTNGSGADSSSVKPTSWSQSVTEQQMIMRELSDNNPDAEADIEVLAGTLLCFLDLKLPIHERVLDFRPPTMYYTSIPLVSERPNNRCWDEPKLRELRKGLDSGTLSIEEIDQVAENFLDGEIVALASDWLGNTVSRSISPYFTLSQR